MDKGWLIICGVLTFVLFLNLGLIMSAIRYRKSRQQPLIGKSISELFNPWAEEDQALEELHHQVAALGREDDLTNDQELG